MDEEIERLVVSVRADTQGFAQDVNAMRGELEGPFADGLERAGRALETGLLRALQRGKFGFEDLRKIALSVMSDIAGAALQNGFAALFPGGSQAAGGGLLGSLTNLIGGLFGLPGRATGGPVSPGRGYRVGESGPEVFVPTSSGQIVPSGRTSQAGNISLVINISDNGHGSAPETLRRSSRHLARSLKRALEAAEH